MIRVKCPSPAWSLLAVAALPFGCGGEASPDAVPVAAVPGVQSAPAASSGPITPTPTNGRRPAVRNIKNRGQTQ